MSLCEKLCGECQFFIDVNDFPVLLKGPIIDRFIKCEKGRTMDSLSYTCELFEPARCTKCPHFFPEIKEDMSLPLGARLRWCAKGLSTCSARPVCEHFPGKVKVQKKPKPVLKLRGGHIDSNSVDGDSEAPDKPKMDEGRESSPPLKLKLRKAVQPKLGVF